jgi:carotenoid cleavage dioxygenase-like enzyme
MKLIYYLFLTTITLINSINKKIPYTLKLESSLNVVKKINGFYGLIGSNVILKNNTSMYDLFMGDGVIQGVFFNNGELTFAKSMVKTEKILFEEKYGVLPKNPLVLFLYFFMNKILKIGMMPNIGGLANTALLNVNNGIYALHEMDYPYLIDIDFKNNKINTVGKKIINNLDHFSAHSKYNKNIGSIESIEYKMDKNMVSFYDLDSYFNLKNIVKFKFKNIPLVHDFYSNDDNLFLIDSPLEIDYDKVLVKKMPLKLNKNKDTYIYVYNKNTKKKDTYICEDGFFLFHYGNIKEDNDYIKIFAPLYEKFDFSDLNIIGKYRMILINKKTRCVYIIKNMELEKYNLDFPVKYCDKFGQENIVLSNKDSGLTNNGFIICNDLKIIKKFIFQGRNIKGEHCVKKIDNINYLLFFSESNGKNFISILNLEDKLDNIIDIEIKEDIQFGFHSIFVPE